MADYEAWSFIYAKQKNVATAKAVPDGAGDVWTWIAMEAYLEALEGAFGADIDYAQLVKIYGAAPEAFKGCYSPSECIGARKQRVEGSPRSETYQHISRRAPEPHIEDALCAASRG